MGIFPELSQWHKRGGKAQSAITETGSTGGINAAKAAGSGEVALCDGHRRSGAAARTTLSSGRGRNG
jgi:hypothetical protein